MKKKSLLMMLLICFAFLGVARAQQELTIYEDGAATSGYVPVYGLWADAYLKCEFVVPADELIDMANGTVSAMTYYLTSPAATAWTGTFQVFLKEVDFTTISDFTGPDGATVVYEGTLDGTQSTMSVAFSNTYTYGGGNLLVGFYQIEKGNYKSCTFQGATVDGASVQGYSSSSLDAISANQRNFIPKTTFVYVGGSVCEKPATLDTSNLGAHDVTLTWTGGSGNYNLEYKANGAEEWTSVLSNSTATTYNLTGLTQNTAYQARVRSNCTGSVSGWKTVSFTTPLACPTPTGLAYTDVTTNSATISWVEAGSATSWQICVNNNEENLIDVNTNPYTITGLTAETTYSIKVRAYCDAIDQSPWSNSVSFTTLVACPAPTGLSVALTSGNGSVATLSWTAGADETSWQICLNGDEDNLIDVSTNSHTLNGLTPETPYTAKVRAYCNAIDQSSWSNTVSFTPTDAYQVTVNDGTNTNNYVPVYGLWVDNYSKSQFIIPADDLAEMVNGTISKMTFYSSNANVSWAGAEFEVYLAEVDYTTFEEATLVDWTTMEKVMDAGSLAISNNKMEVTLTNPYQYLGGNLMIGVLQTTSGSYSSCIWYGVSQEENTTVGGYETSKALGFQKFLPKTTFDYEPGEAPSCPKPTHVAVDYQGGTTATVSWNSDASNFNISVNGTVTNNVTNPYTLSGLNLATTYEVKVQAKCSGSDVSDWSNPVSFTTDLCLPENQCEITYVLEDSYGDGWNGNAIQVTDLATGIVIATWTIPSGGNYASGTIAVCDGAELQFAWISGTYVNETSYTVTDINDEVIVEGSGAGFTTLTYTVSCTITNCKRPTNLAASNIGGHSAELSWTENGEATEWVLAYKVAGDDKYDAMEASTNPFTLTGLDPETTYNVKVRPVCEDGVEKWSNEITFTTDVACPAPTAMNITNLMPTSATVNWTSMGSEFDLRYAVFGTGKNLAKSQNATPKAIPTNLSKLAADPNAQTHVANSADMRGRGWLQYDDGTFATSIGMNDETLTLTWAAMYPASMLGGNTTLTKVSFYSMSGYTNPITITVFSGGDDEPGTMLYTETVSPDALDAFQEVTLAEEVTINPSANLWIQLAQQGAYPIASCASTEPNNQWIYYEDEEEPDYDGWYNIGDLGSSLASYGWMIRAYVTGFDPSTLSWIEVNGLTEKSYDFTGLDPETRYKVQVRSNCGDDGYSEWAELEFTTPGLCDEIEDLEVEPSSTTAALDWTGYQEMFNIRYRTPELAEQLFYDGFENGLDGWTTIRNGGGTEYTDWRQFDATNFTSGNVTNHTGNYVAMSRSWSNTAYTVDNWLITPQISLEGMLKFWVCDDGTYHEHYDVYISTTGTAIDDFTLVYEPGNASGTWSEVSVDLSSYGGVLGYIALRHSDTDQDYLLIDDFGIYGNTIPAGPWNETQSDDSEAVLEGLDPETTYEVQVQGVCSKDETTEWTDPVTFTTTAICGVTPELVDVEDVTDTSIVGLDWTVGGDNISWNLRYRPYLLPDAADGTLEDPEHNALVTLYIPSDVWGDGSGYQMLLDADATAYGAVIPETGGLTTSGDASDAVYAEFEYKIPVNADGSLTTANILVEGSISIEIPAGTYDWCVTNPTPEDRVWIATNGRADDYTFEAGKDYTFEVYMNGSNDNVELLLEAGDWITVETDQHPYDITGLQPSTFYEIQVQGVCQDGYLSEWSEEGIGVQTMEAQTPTEIDQTYTISSGWNWMSSYLECSDELFTALKEGIAANNTSAIIKNMDGSTMLQGGSWSGTLAFVNESMYMMNIGNATEVTVTAAPADPAAHPITLKPGWNWIGYVSVNEMNVNDALTNITPSNGDVIKNMDGVASFTGSAWQGNLTKLEPGKGYMYFNKATSNLTLVYPASAKAVVNYIPVEKYWSTNVHEHATNLVLMATLDESQFQMAEGNYEIGAFVDGECRGSARLQKTDNGFIAFLVIHGEAEENVSFQLYDVVNAEIVGAGEEELRYVPNAITGSIEEPVVLHFRGVTDVNEDANRLSVYPNPAKDNLMIEGHAIEMVSVYNTLGQCLLSETFGDASNVELNMSSLSAGVYTVSIRTNGTMVTKMIVKE